MPVANNQPSTNHVQTQKTYISPTYYIYGNGIKYWLALAEVSTNNNDSSTCSKSTKGSKARR